MIETVDIDYEELMKRLIMAENLLERAKTELWRTDGAQMKKDDYNSTLEFARLVLLESKINSRSINGGR